MNVPAFTGLRAALWTVLLLSVAVAVAGSLSLHDWLDSGWDSATQARSTEPAAIVPGGAAMSIDRSVVASDEVDRAEDLPSLSVAAYER